jgi:hypothetical protein
MAEALKAVYQMSSIAVVRPSPRLPVSSRIFRRFPLRSARAPPFSADFRQFPLGSAGKVTQVIENNR